MPDRKVILVRFYPETDADLIEWLASLVAGDGNDTIKSMLRAGIAASQSGNLHPTQSVSRVSMAALDPANLQAVLEDFLPRIRAIVDASLASANFTHDGRETTLQDNNTASADLLKGHLLGEGDDE